MEHNKNSEFLVSSLILLVTVILSVVAFVQWYDLSFFVGSLFFVHWLSILAITFIVVSVPVYFVLKRKRPQNKKMLQKIHVFGNLLAFLLVSTHFSQNIGRLAGFYQRWGSGFILFIVLSVIVATGMLERFRAKRNFVQYMKPVHRYTVAVFYLVTVVHVLQSLGII